MIGHNYQSLSIITRSLKPRFGQKFSRCYATEPAKIVKNEKELEVTEDLKILEKQAPNRVETWAPSQQPRINAMVGPRFVQKNLAAQPRPDAAIELIASEPVRFIEHHIAVCDGGRGVQGHPKVYINLDQVF